LPRNLFFLEDILSRAPVTLEAENQANAHDHTAEEGCDKTDAVIAAAAEQGRSSPRAKHCRRRAAPQ